MNVAAAVAVHEFVALRARIARSDADAARDALTALPSRAPAATEAWARWNTAETHARRCADAYVESLAELAAEVAA